MVINFEQSVEIDVTIGNRKISKKELQEMNRCQEILGKDKNGRKIFLEYLQKSAYPLNKKCTSIAFEDIGSFDNFINNCRRTMGEL